MSNLILFLLIFGLHGYWIYSVATYDWSNFEKHSEGDDFLKPHDE